MATYAFQLVLICFFPVPSAGSTAAMLLKKGGDNKISRLHPAGSARQSMPRVIVMISATLVVVITALIPLVTIVFPPAVNYLLLVVKVRPDALIIAGVFCLVLGNALTYAAVRTL